MFNGGGMGVVSSQDVIMERKVKTATPSLLDVITSGLKSSSAKSQLSICKIFADFRGAVSIEAALQELIGMNRDQALAFVADFQAYLATRRLAQRSLVNSIRMVRKVVRKARFAGLTTLNLDRPLPDPASLMGVILGGMTPRTANATRRIYKIFADFRGAASIETAFQELIKMDRDQAETVINGFKAHQIDRCIAKTTAAMWASAVRTAIRKAHAAGLTTLVIDKPPAAYVPGSLMDIILSGLNPLTAETQMQIYKGFADFRGAASVEAAFQELIKMDRDQAETVINGFHARLVERKLAPGTVAIRVSKIRTVVRKAHAAGLTPVDLDSPRVEYALGSLMDISLRGLKLSSAKVVRKVYKEFANFRGAASIEVALQALADMKSADQVEAELTGFEAHKINRGAAPLTASHCARHVRCALRKLHAAGRTTLDLGRYKGPAGSGRQAVAKHRGPKSRNPERDDFCIQQREQGVSYGEIMRQINLRPEWTSLASKQAVREAIKGRCKALGRDVPRVSNVG
jgi:hypothetical protein